MLKITSPPREPTEKSLRSISLIGGLFFRLATQLLKKTIQSSDIIQAITHEIYNSLHISHHIPKKKITLIPNGITLADFDALYKSEKSQWDKFGYVGRLEKVKNVPVILQAFSMMKEQHPSYKLLIYGDGNEREKIEDYRTELGLLDEVIMCGYEDNQQKIYSSIDYFIIASSSEGLSNSLLEAMAAGIPILASNIPGNTFVIKDKVEGLLFDPNDPKDLEDKMQILIKNPQLRETIRYNARLKIKEKFDINIVIDSLLGAMCDLVKYKKSRH